MNKFFRAKGAIFVFTLPALIWYTLFKVFPLLPEIVYSFQDYNGFTSNGFVGLENYKAVLTAPSFWTANKNTLIIVLLAFLVATPISLTLALLMDKQTKGVRGFYKFTSVFPAVMSVTVISQMWLAIYEPEWGLINTVLRMLGLDSWCHVWMGEEGTVIFCIAFTFLWQYIGLNGLLFYSGIKSIPVSYYEAAQIDGAGFWKASFYITIPLLKDVGKYVITTTILGSMGMFAYVKAMTGGGPGFASRTTMFEMYYRAFSTSEFDQGCAIAVLFIIQCVIVALIINKFFGKEKTEF